MTLNTRNPDLFMVLGGTGIIGSEVAKVLKERGIFCASVSLDPTQKTEDSSNIQINLKTTSPTAVERALRELINGYRLVGILDIIGVRGPIADCVRELAEERDISVGVISSCLLYDHSPDDVVDESFPTIQPEKATYPYHIEKLKVESFWKESPYKNWLIFRTNHVLGRGSLLGCIPNHNRDRDLLDRLKGRKPLALSNRGNVRLSYIHPHDLANLAIDMISNSDLRSTVVNLVHPEPVRARSYYNKISEFLGYPTPEFVDFASSPNDFWSVTASDSIYTSAVPAIQTADFAHDIDDCIRDALSVGEKSYPELGTHLMQRIAG